MGSKEVMGAGGLWGLRELLGLRGLRTMRGQKVLGRLGGDDFVVALDERGKDLSSEGLAELLAEPPGGAGRVVFLIGGPSGHSPEVRERARARGAVVRLSRMVLNHQVARLVALEQIYRGWTIIRGEKYHH